MITNTQPGRRAWMRKALVAPVVLGAVLFFACSKDESPQAAKVPPPPPPGRAMIVDDGNQLTTRGKDTLFLTTSTGKIYRIVPSKTNPSSTEGKKPASFVIVRDSLIGVKP